MLFKSKYKRLVYCQYGQYSLTFRALALRQRETKRRRKRNERDEGPTLETLDYTIHIGSTRTFLYFDLYLYSVYAAHYVYACCLLVYMLMQCIIATWLTIYTHLNEIALPNEFMLNFLTCFPNVGTQGQHYRKRMERYL